MEPKHRFTATHPAGCEPAFACSTWTQSHWNHVIESYIIRELIPLTEKTLSRNCHRPPGAWRISLLPMGVRQSCQQHALGNFPRKTLLTEVICVLYHPVSREVLRAVSQCLCLGRSCWAHCCASHLVLASLPSVPKAPLPPCSSLRLPRSSWVEKETRSKESWQGQSNMVLWVAPLPMAGR